MLSALEWNLNHGQRNLRLFEIGRAYELRNGEPVETPVLTLGATGLAREKSIHEEARELSFADLKGDLDRIGELAGGFTWQSGGPEWLAGARGARISAGKSGDEALGRRQGNSPAASPTSSSCGRRFSSRSCGSSRFLRASRARKRRGDFRRYRVFRQSRGISRWCFPTASHSRRWRETIRALGIPELQQHRSRRPVPRRPGARREILA